MEKLYRVFYLNIWHQYDKQMYKFNWISSKHKDYVSQEDEQVGNHKKIKLITSLLQY